ncbi:NepR family anti-sigma factor [Roseomonas sp. HF4]|uniref:NepR family anti-sigma factor n=1 Tax=Roseomonas sp. HF4 TaxID=2562313 RepID=UPI0010BFE650|nr:NepR family anti-sigma factor [Roseomonas sp. HF4]
MDESEDSGEDPEAQVPGDKQRPRSRTAPALDDAFDIWLRRGLHAMFDEIAQEPIPDELLRLIEADRRK